MNACDVCTVTVVPLANTKATISPQSAASTSPPDAAGSDYPASMDSPSKATTHTSVHIPGKANAVGTEHEAAFEMAYNREPVAGAGDSAGVPGAPHKEAVGVIPGTIASGVSHVVQSVTVSAANTVDAAADIPDAQRGEPAPRPVSNFGTDHIQHTLGGLRAVGGGVAPEKS